MRWAVLASAALATALSAYIIASLRHKSKFSTIPGPPITFLSLFIGDFALLSRDPIVGGRLPAILELLRKYGGNSGIVRVHGPLFQSFVFISDPELVKEMMVTNRDEWTVGNRKPIRAVTGQGLLVLRGEEWRQQRELINPMFHFQKLAPMTPTILAATDTLLARLGAAAQSGTPLDIHKYFMQLTLDIIGTTAFGLEFKAQSDTPSDIARILTSMLTGGASSGGGLPMVKTMLRDVITERTAAANGPAGDGVPQDLLTLLITAKDPKTGAHMSGDAVMAEVMTFLLAGHDTTANLMSWFVVALCDNPAVNTRLLAELYARVPRTSSSVSSFSHPDPEGLAQCNYLDCVIKETLRFHSPVPQFGRIPVRDGVTLGGGKYSIPKGVLTVAAPWIIHHHPDLWNQPEVFNPLRFETSAHGDTASPFSYMPFSVGPRRCIGSNFAMMEARLVLSQIFRHFTLEVLELPVKGQISVVRRPAKPLMVRVTQRS